MQIDARGPRFGAAITMVVLLLVIYFDSALLLAIQTLVWAIGAFAGPHKSPYGFIFKTLWFGPSELIKTLFCLSALTILSATIASGLNLLLFLIKC